MVLAGDECRRTQQGNNNAWCQDNALSWFDWQRVKAHADLVRFVGALTRFRLGNPTLRRPSFLLGGVSASGTLPDVEWFSPEGAHIDWYAADASLTCFFGAPTAEELARDPDPAAGGTEGTPRHVLVFAHAGSLPRTFCFPDAEPLRALEWRTFIQTAALPPADIFPDGQGPLVDVSAPLVLPERSLVCLVADAVRPSAPRSRIAPRRG
jgi:glycogen operon protein